LLLLLLLLGASDMGASSILLPSIWHRVTMATYLLVLATGIII